MEFDAGGRLLRTTQLGSSQGDEARGIAVDDADNVYIAGHTAGTLPGSLDPSAGTNDAFVARLTPGVGSHFRTVWVHQLGSDHDDFGMGIAATANGTATTVGLTGGTLPGSPRVYAGVSDLFVARVRPRWLNAKARAAVQGISRPRVNGVSRISHIDRGENDDRDLA